MPEQRHDFRGFDDWVEVFRAGRQTDSQGRSREWTDADLDSVVAHFDAGDPPPAVVGHPRADAPAYGWVEGLRRSGRRLLAKFGQVQPAFEGMVREGRFKKRSVAFDPTTDGGYKLRHVGWLGAAAPAVPGLAPVQFADSGETLEFEADWQTPDLLSGLLRNLREWFIEKFNTATADRVLPEHAITRLTEHATALRVQPEPPAPEPAAAFSTGDPEYCFAATKLAQRLNSLIDKNSGDRADVINRMAKAAGIKPSTVHQILNGSIEVPPDERLRGFARVLGVSLQHLKAALPKRFTDHGGSTMPEFTQADIDTAVAAATEQATQRTATLEASLAAERNTRRRAEFQATLDAAIDAGRLTPAQAPGALEFMLSLPEGEAARFTFAAAEGEAAGEPVEPVAWFEAFLGKLGPQGPESGESDAGAPLKAGAAARFNAPDGYAVDADHAALHQRALDFQAAHPGTEYLAAVQAVEQAAE